jgi:2-dehydropantoate 2-reductase
MKYVVIGAGAIGGTIGARLFEAGHQVTLVARGAHRAVIAEQGLRLEEPGRTRTLRLPVAASVADVAWRQGDVAVLATKSQDSEAVLDALRTCASRVTVVCAQNGVANERLAAHRFAAVQAMCVMLPAEHLEPGLVLAYSTPTPGILDVGTFPAGITEDSERIAADLRGAGFSSRPDESIMRWKYRKLLTNLANAAQAACGLDDPDLPALTAAARREGQRCLEAADIDVATEDEDHDRRGTLISMQPINGRARQGGSTWQSLRRATGSVESRYLNGEIVDLGHRHDVPTPVNRLLLDTASNLAHDKTPPGEMNAAHLLELARDLD